MESCNVVVESFIPTGASTKHKARTITATVQLFLVEDV